MKKSAYSGMYHEKSTVTVEGLSQSMKVLNKLLKELFLYT